MGARKFLTFVLLLWVTCLTGNHAFCESSRLSAAFAPAQDSSSSSSHRSKNQGKERGHPQNEGENSPSSEIEKADNLIHARDYSAAEMLLRKAVESDPKNYVAWFDLGFVENALGRIDDSIAAYRKSVELKPDVFESNLNLGLQLAKQKQPDSEKFLRAATQLKPTSNVDEGRERAWLSLAQVIESSQPEEALASYRHAAELQPKDSEPHLGAGRLLEQANNIAEAEQEYKQALAIDPESDALTALANLYMQTRKFPEAEECLRKMVAAHPERAQPHVQLGRVLAAQAKNDDAIAELEAGAKLVPADVSLRRDLADLYAATGKNDLAESAYRALLATDPANAQMHRALGETLLRQKQFPEAQQEFLTALKLKPDLCEVYGDLGFAANENKNYALTIRALDARAKCLPEIPITYFLRASAFDHLRDYKQAAANYHLFLNAANGKYPDQEWQAKHRLIAIEPHKR